MNRIDDFGAGCFGVLLIFALWSVTIGLVVSAYAQNLGAPHGDAGLYYSDRAAWEAKRAEQDAKQNLKLPDRIDLTVGGRCGPYGACVDKSGKIHDGK